MLMLLATLCYPLGYDQAVFSVGGESILKHGAIPYRDFLDTKPPLIFYIYSAAIGLFGHHEWSIRLFDILYQIGASFYFYRILRRYFDAGFALASVSLAVITYAGLGFWHTAQAESFAFLPSLVLLDVTLLVRPIGGRTLRLGVYAGIATAVLFLLKFTLVLGAVAAVLFILIRRDIRAKDRMQYLLGIASSFVVILAGFAFMLAQCNALTPFLQVMRWTLRYAAITALATGKTFAEQLFLLFPKALVYNASMTLFLLGVLGMLLYFKQVRSGKRNPIMSLLILTGFFQLAGVLLERKIVFGYQYARALWAFTPLSAMGLFSAVRFAGKFWERIALPDKGPRVRGAALILAVVCVALALSPLARIYTQSIPWTVMALRGENTSTEVHKRIRDYYADEQRATGEYLRSRMTSTDKLFFWGNDVAVYWYANALPPTICLTATPLRTAWTPKAWRDTMMKQLSEVRPKYFVTEFGDAKEYITGAGGDSYAALQQWPELANYLSSNFIRDTVIGHYIVFISGQPVRSDRSD